MYIHVYTAYHRFVFLGIRQFVSRRATSKAPLSLPGVVGKKQNTRPLSCVFFFHYFLPLKKKFKRKNNEKINKRKSIMKKKSAANKK